eukprot:Selendium_serpulae@DN8020_c0_g1_i1.p2
MAWTFPSEQQFAKSVAAKGHDVDPQLIPTVLAIHNEINEMAWQRILEFEKFHHKRCPTPKLSHFVGRPAARSAKSRLLTALGFAPPFDRHDWFVDRCGRRVRYLIDFYDGSSSSSSSSPIATEEAIPVLVDARPELRSLSAAADRTRMFFKRTTQIARLFWN